MVISQMWKTYSVCQQGRFLPAHTSTDQGHNLAPHYATLDDPRIKIVRAANTLLISIPSSPKKNIILHPFQRSNTIQNSKLGASVASTTQVHIMTMLIPLIAETSQVAYQDGRWYDIHTGCHKHRSISRI
jgi:hypothetical protein